ncbi:unnamed protein product [Cunninghamella blakesleeana]
MSKVENDTSDILWIDTNLPIIASIYYHLYLNEKYSFYCPDEENTIEPQHVRDLVRGVLKVVDKNSHKKKLVLSFLKPISNTKREDFLRFLYKKRPTLHISYLTLPYGSTQQYALSGWIYTLNKQNFHLWLKQCLIYQPTLFPPPKSIPSDNIYIDHNLNLPFLITANPFIKKAFIIDICSNMIQMDDDKIEFNNTTMNAINGYMDAAMSSEQGSSIILIGHEYTFFTNQEHYIMQQSDKQQMKQLLEEKRKKIWHWIESLATSFPIYLFLNEYHKLNNQKLYQSLAWLHHRHHLSLSKSIILTWKAYEFDSTCSNYLTQINCMDLLSTAKFTRNKWKNDFILILNGAECKSTSEELLHILPSKLNISIDENWIAPLYDSGSPFLQTKLEYNDSFIHSVSSSTEEIASNWKNINYENWIQYQRANEHDLNIDDTITEEEMNIKKLESILFNVNHEVIMNYIANTGAYSRGEKLLDTLECLSYSWNEDDNLLLFSKAQGTGNVPYNVYICINRYIKDNQVIKNGYCSCPVGMKGKCKHCTALLLRFIINIEEFDHSKKPIVIPNVDDQIASIISEIKDNSSNLVLLTTINQDTNSNHSTQTNDQNDKDDVQIEKRRVLPWVLGKNKHNEDDDDENEEEGETNEKRKDEQEKNKEKKDDMDQPPRKKKQKTSNTKESPKKLESIKNDITTSAYLDESLQIDTDTTKQIKSKNKNNKSKNKNKNKKVESESSDSDSDDFNNKNSEFYDVFINPKKIPSAKSLPRKPRTKKEIKMDSNELSHSPTSTTTDYIMVENKSLSQSPPPSSSSSPLFNRNFSGYPKKSSTLSYPSLIDFSEEKEHQKDTSSSIINSTHQHKDNGIFSFLSMEEDISLSSSSPNKFLMNHDKQSSIISSSLSNREEGKNQKDTSLSSTVNDPYIHKNSDISFSFLSMNEASSLFSDLVPQGSTLSLPLTDLALSNQAQMIDNDNDNDVDSVDEEFQKFLEEQKEKSYSQRNSNKHSKIDIHDDVDDGGDDTVDEEFEKFLQEQKEKINSQRNNNNSNNNNKDSKIEIHDDDGDDTVDEEFENFLEEQKEKSISQQNNNNNNSNDKRSKIDNNEEKELDNLKMSTSDIFDELGL